MGFPFSGVGPDLLGRIERRRLVKDDGGERRDDVDVAEEDADVGAAVASVAAYGIGWDVGAI